MYNRKLTTKEIRTKNKSWIRLSERKGRVVIEFSAKPNYAASRIKGRVLTSITADLNAFERKAVLVYAYKTVEEFASSFGIGYKGFAVAHGIKERLRDTNYAEVFGSPWL